MSRILGPASFNPAGRVALITGAGAGIGEATARLLVASGASVALVDVNEIEVKQLCADLGPRAIAVVGDVTDPDAMSWAVGRTVEAFGSLDLVVANAGITPRPATVRHTDVAEFSRVLAVNTLGVLHTVQPAIEHLIRSRGHIVVVASAAAYSPPLAGAAYMASKAATEVLGRALRLELAGHGVGVTTVCFGFVDTNLARATLDQERVGPRLQQMLPQMLRRRISAHQAAEVILRACRDGSPRATAPRAWAPLGVLRGVLSPVIDELVIRSGRASELVALLEEPCPTTEEAPR